MGNTIVGGRRRVKVMSIDGQTFELKTPLTAGDVTKDYPGHVLIEAEAVRTYGIRAEPLEPQEALKSKRLYFLVEIPKFPHQEEKKNGLNSLHRKVKPGVQMSAKERIESLMLSRRATSDLSFVKAKNLVHDAGMVRVKLRVPKSEVAKLMDESQDASEAAEKIMDLCITKSGLATADNNGIDNDDDDDDMYTLSGPLLGYEPSGDDDGSYSKSGPLPQQSHWKPTLEGINEGSNRARPRVKKVSFLPMNGEQLE